MEQTKKNEKKRINGFFSLPLQSSELGHETICELTHLHSNNIQIMIQNRENNKTHIYTHAKIHK